MNKSIYIYLNMNRKNNIYIYIYMCLFDLLGPLGGFGAPFWTSLDFEWPIRWVFLEIFGAQNIQNK